jgi:nucleotide-binding universal stress UspA family protein
MITPQRILAATDFSSSGNQALERAAELSKALGAHLELVHVQQTSMLERLEQWLGSKTADIEENLQQQNRLNLQDLATGLHARHGISCGVHIVQGDLRATLISEADRQDSDLLIVGAHGESQVQQGLIGSTPIRLLKGSQRPVLVVRKAAEGEYRKVLVAVEFSSTAMATAKMACALAPNAEITLLHALEAPFEGKLRNAGVEESQITQYLHHEAAKALQQLQALVQELPANRQHNLHPLVIHGEASQAILAQPCDLILIGRHGKNSLEDLLLGSVTRHVVNQAHCDVLICNH